MKLTMTMCEVLEDWYIIERAEHDGRSWMERTEYGARFMTSARIGDADIEGNAREMLDIAEAIEARGEDSFKRCAVLVEGGRARFWSPRNTNDEDSGWVSLADADALATEIRAKLDASAKASP